MLIDLFIRQDQRSKGAGHSLRKRSPEKSSFLKKSSTPPRPPKP